MSKNYKQYYLQVDNIRIILSKLEDIYSSKEWTNFFDIVVNKPEKAMNYCQYKCGNAKWIPKT